MKRALELAERGRGLVHPNPLVGAVLVRGEAVIGEGFHARFGAKHAEVSAIDDAVERGNDPRGAELFVTLEPCNHHGKTPPCTELIISREIHKVFFAMHDPNPAVSGSGHRRLESAGIVVEEGLCRDEALQLNEAYVHFHRCGLPFVTWKSARTADGAVTFAPGRETAITGPEARDYVDNLRASADAVMVGVETVITDDPGLRVRNGCGRDPFRIVFDSSGRIPENCRLLRENADRKTIVISTEPRPGIDAEIIVVPAKNGRIDLVAAMKRIAEKGMLSVLLEAGNVLGTAMVEAGLVKRLVMLQAPALAVTGQRGTFTTVDRIGGDARTVIDLS